MTRSLLLMLGCLTMLLGSQVNELRADEPTVDRRVEMLEQFARNAAEQGKSELSEMIHKQVEQLKRLLERESQRREIQRTLFEQNDEQNDDDDDDDRMEHRRGRDDDGHGDHEHGDHEHIEQGSKQERGSHREHGEAEHDGHAEHHHPADHEAIGGRIHHLRVAAENLHAAGMHREGDELMHRAEQMERELHGQQGRGPDQMHAEAMHMIQDTHRQVTELREQVEQLQNQIRQLQAMVRFSSTMGPRGGEQRGRLNPPFNPGFQFPPGAGADMPRGVEPGFRPDEPGRPPMGAPVPTESMRRPPFDRPQGRPAQDGGPPAPPRPERRGEEPEHREPRAPRNVDSSDGVDSSASVSPATSADEPIDAAGVVIRE